MSGAVAWAMHLKACHTKIFVNYWPHKGGDQQRTFAMAGRKIWTVLSRPRYDSDFVDSWGPSGQIQGKVVSQQDFVWLLPQIAGGSFSWVSVS